MRRFVSVPARLCEIKAIQRINKGFLTRREHVVDFLIEYDYEFGQMAYRAQVEREAAIDRRDVPVSDEVVEEAVAAMRAGFGGGAFPVWVDPKRPEFSLLERPGIRRETIAMVVFAVLTGVFGALSASLMF